MNRIIITPEQAKFIGKRYIEKESGAKIRIDNKYNKSTVTVSGNETQCERAKVLIKEAIEKSFIIPAIGIKLLELDNHNIKNVDKAKFKFIKYEEEEKEEIVRPNNKNKYFIRLIKNDSNNQESLEDDLASLFNKKLDISPKDTGFVTSENLEDCLNKICSQLSKTDPTDNSKRDVRLNLFFGHEFFLFKDVEKEVFDIKEWINLDSGRRISSIFQQSAPQILKKMSILEKNFGFKEDKTTKTTSNDKNSIAVYFVTNSSKRKFKLHWDAEEGLWKITKYVRNINRIAILDSISGNEAPDYRFLLKTFYGIQIKSDLKNIINEIQSKSSFNSTRDEMWFRVKDFDNKLEKVEIRQTMTKRRFFNERFQISVVDIKQESADNELSFQQTISLKNRSWRSVENINQSLGLDYDEREISNTIRETVRYAREIVKALS